MANAIARKAMAQSVTSSSLAASGWNQVFGNGAAQGPTPKQSFRQDLNVRLVCKNCKIDPPNIVEETANGDLVSERRPYIVTLAVTLLTNRFEATIGMCGLRVGARR